MLFLVVNHIASANYTTQNHSSPNNSTSPWLIHQLLSTEGISNRISKNPSSAIDSKNNLHVVWEDNSDYNGSGSDFDILYRNYNATSGSWSITIPISLGSTGNCQGAKIAIDSNDNLHVVWYERPYLSNSGDDYDVFYVTYNSTQLKWSTTQLMSTNSEGRAVGPFIEIDSKDNIHVVWSGGGLV
ncbi:MAG: hypothetical protein ACW99Q_25355, partial [Candidatus Kariarchaeaceae archaeon]